MSMLLSQFHFLRPWWLLLALVWLPLLAWRMRTAQRGGRLGALADAVLLPHLLVGTRRARYGTWVLAFVAGALATLALAGPTWQRLPQPLYADGAAQVVVVSLSRRMLARDVKPDRMQRVRFKVHDLLHANADGRNGLVAYAGAAFTVAPLTTDAHALDDLLDALAPDVMPVAGDAPAKGIARGAKLLRQGGVHGGSLIIVTDRVDAAAIAEARRVHAAGVRVSALGVGTTSGAPVTLANGSLLTDAAGNVVVARRDDASLRALAAAGGGIYVPMRADHADIEALTAELARSHRAAAPATAKGNRWRDMGPWLLLPLVLLAALSFRRGWLLVLPLVLLPCIVPLAHAADVLPVAADRIAGPVQANPAGKSAPWGARWSALWHNADQRAAQALADGHPQRALALARAPALRGAAAYRAGKYAAAARAYRQADGPNAAYNLGNALARQGRYEQAIKAYTRALHLDPGNADARANRKAVRDWLRRHKPPPRLARKHGQPGAQKNGQHGQSGTQQNRQHGQSGTQQNRQHGQSRNASPAGKSNAARQPAGAASSSPPARAGSVAPRSRPAPATSAGRAQPSPAPGARPSATANPTPDVRAARAGRDAASRASRALQRQLPAAPARQTPTFNLGQAPARASSVAPLPQSMERALERIPDDPGGLLRRKFQLEYQERQSGQGGSGA